MTIRHEAEGADAVEAIRQDVEQKAADELVHLQSHHFGRATIAIVLPGEADMSVIEADETGVGDGDTVGVAAEISEDLCRTTKGLLGVDDPVGLAHSRELRGERRGIGQWCEIAEEAELTGGERLRQLLEKQTAKDQRKRFDRQEEPGTSGNPARSIGRDATAGNDAMEMWVMSQRLTPRMQNGETADLRAKPARVRRQRCHRCRSRPEQDRVDDPLVLERDRGDRLG